LPRWPVFAALVTVQVLFGSLPVAAKLALRDLSSPTLALLRVAFAAVLFLVLWRLAGGERIRSRADYLRLALYGFLGVIANQLLYLTALSLTTATAAQTLMTTGPAMTLLAAIALGKERGTVARWTGISLAGAGALILVGVDVAGASPLGNTLVLLNVAAFSLYLVLSRDILQRYGPLTVITWTFVFGAVGLSPIALGGGLSEVAGMSTLTWAALAWIVLLPTVTAYYLNVWALRQVESSVVAVFIYLQPMVTAALAIPILGETIPARMIPAAVLIFTGVGMTALLSGRGRRAGQT
jgi:drug/metabolite transporter (DMT)-like permease